MDDLLSSTHSVHAHRSTCMKLCWLMELDYTLRLPCSLTYTGSLSAETKLTESIPLQTKVKSTNFSSPGKDNSPFPATNTMPAASSGKVSALLPLTIHDKASPSVVQVKMAVELMQTVVFTGGTRMAGAAVSNT